jgi:hypothetical protein
LLSHLHSLLETCSNLEYLTYRTALSKSEEEELDLATALNSLNSLTNLARDLTDVERNLEERNKDNNFGPLGIMSGRNKITSKVRAAKRFSQTRNEQQKRPDNLESINDDVDVSFFLRRAIEERNGVSGEEAVQLVRSGRLFSGGDTAANLNKALAQAQLAVNRVIDFLFDTIERVDNGILTTAERIVMGKMNIIRMIVEGIFGSRGN